MLHAWIPRVAIAIDGPNWSLSVEAFLYLCFPLIATLLWKLNGNRLLVSAIIVYLAGQVLTWCVAARLSYQVSCYNPILHLSTFALGILLAPIQSMPTDRAIRRRFLSSSVSWILLVLPASIFALIVYFHISLSRPNLYDGLPGANFHVPYLVRFGLTNACIGHPRESMARDAGRGQLWTLSNSYCPSACV